VLGRVFGPGRTDASIVLPRRPLAEVFASPARAYLEARGGDVRFDALARVEIGEAQVRRVHVRGVPEPAAHVVLAAPWHTWPSVLVGDTTPIANTIAAAAATAPSPIVTVTLAYDRQVLSGPMLGLPGRVMQWAFDTAVPSGAGPGTRVALVSSGASELLRSGNDELARVAHEVLAGALPAARSATPRAARVLREPRATFSLAPGQPRRPATRSPVRGLYLASDWVDTGLPATIEGAIEAGHRAAAALLEDLGERPVARSDQVAPGGRGVRP
jgi:predicted NAD/FAD-dependent oxidoreductase